MNKIHFWLLGLGVGGLAFEYFNGFPYGGVGIGLPIGAIGLGIRQWFAADAHAERQSAAISNTSDCGEAVASMFSDKPKGLSPPVPAALTR